MPEARVSNPHRPNATTGPTPVIAEGGSLSKANNKHHALALELCLEAKSTVKRTLHAWKQSKRLPLMPGT